MSKGEVRSAVASLLVRTPESDGRDAQHEPVTVGIPLPRGIVHQASHLAITDENGCWLPLQAVATDRWADGSIRWALLDFQVTGRVSSERRYALHVMASEPATSGAGLTVHEDPRAITIATPNTRFVMRVGSSFPFADVHTGDRAHIDGAQTALRVTDGAGRACVAHLHTLVLEERGPLRATVRMEGTVGSRRRPLLIVIARIQFFAGSSAVRLSVTLRNPRRAQHRGGFWELGDRGSVNIKDASLCIGLPSLASRVQCSPEIDAPTIELQTPVELYQDSSGGEKWNHRTHLNREGRIPCTFRGYRLSGDKQHSEGLRATPALTVHHEQGTVGLVVRQFWQNCPKAIQVDPRTLIYRLFPHQYNDVHELQGGEQKTHSFTLIVSAPGSSRDDGWFWARTPSVVCATPSLYCDAVAVPYLTPIAALGSGSSAAYEGMISAALEGHESLFEKRERADEYGWRHFGDLYADHENAFSRDERPIVSHYNNQYDAVAGFAAQFMRSGNPRWWELMDDLSRHVVDIDIYHTDRDKAAYNQGLFWHTAHYVDAGKSTHRSYPRSPRVGGGGLSNEHNYATGLMLHYFLTGDRASRDSAIGLARWAIAMDDGSKTVFRWLARTATGLASQTSSPDYHGPGRGAGHSLRALLDGHRLTGESVFLEKAEEIIRRVIHPADDVAAHNLLDAERRWSYTAFLQALAVYLDHKAERDQIDGMYHYARASLLQYVRWMVSHEYPYLDKPDILEYPTETWAAQDLRKSDVFYFAAWQTSDDERPRLLERGAFFFDAAVQRLSSMSSRTLTRPIVLLLTNGKLHGYAQSRQEFPRTTGDEVVRSLPPNLRFVPQKARAKARLIGAAAVIAVAALLPLLATLVN